VVMFDQQREARPGSTRDQPARNQPSHKPWACVCVQLSTAADE
jgi:hypothetical protein